MSDDDRVTDTQRRRHAARWASGVPVVAVPADPAADLSARVADLERGFAPIRSVARWAAGGALAALIAVGAALYSRGAAEQRTLDRLDQLERAIERLETQIHQLQIQRAQ